MNFLSKISALAGISTPYVGFDTNPSGVPTSAGTVFWDIDDNTLDIIMNGTTQKVGEDLFYPVKNQTGSTIPKGTVVRFAGTLGSSGRLLIAPFLANGTFPSKYFMGVTSEDIADGADGKVYQFGRCRGINTSSYPEGTILYASTTVAGAYQTAVPQAPNNIVQVAAVISSGTNGTIFVRPSIGSNINEDEGVKITSVANNNILAYDSAQSLWINNTVAGVLGYTPIGGTGTTNYLPKFTGSTTIGDSIFTEVGGNTLRIVAANAALRLTGSREYLLQTVDADGRFRIYDQTAALERVTLTSAGNVGIGTTSLTNVTLSLGKNITGATSSYSILAQSQIQSDVTANAYYFRSLPSTQATAFTLTNLYHYSAGQSTIGAGSSVSAQVGYNVEATLVGATNNYGFQGNIPSGTGRWNLYMNGTANNYLAGSLGIGTTSLTNSNLRISKNITGSVQTFTLNVDGQIQADVTTEANLIRTQSNQITGATLTDLNHFVANQGTISGTLTSQTGFAVGNLSTGTNVYGYRSNIASGTNRWNLYIGGTANNYLAGNLGIGINDITSRISIAVAGTNNSSTSIINATTDNPAYRASIQLVREATSGQLGWAFTTNAVTSGEGTERMRITSTGNVGIGTTSPDFLLDVVRTTTGTVATFGIEGQTINPRLRIDADESNNTITLNPNYSGATSPSLVFKTQEIERMRITSSGNVGIGSSTIQNVATNRTSVTINGTNTSVLSFANGDVLKGYIYNDGTNIDIYSANATIFTAGGSEKMRISSSGNVGIATASITEYGLRISKTLTGATIAYGVRQDGQVQADVTSIAVGFRNLSNIASSANPSNYRHYWATQGTINGTLQYQVGFLADNTIIAGSLGNYGFQGSIDSGTGRYNLYMSGTANNYIAGNLGMGAFTPQSKIHIDGGNATASYVQFTAGTTTGQTASDGFDVGIDSSGNAILNQQEALAMIFSTSATERMRLDSSGNLGLGVTPSAWNIFDKVLQVGAASLVNYQNTDNTFIGSNVYYGGSPTNFRYITSSNTATLYRMESGVFKWLTAPSGTAGTAISFTQAMTLDASGNLLLGTTSSNGSRLQVTGSATFSSSVTATGFSAGSGTNIAGIGAGTIGFYNAASSPKYITLTDDNSTINAIGFSKSGAVSTIWFPSGNVGIGTASPRTLLQLTGGGISAYHNSGSSNGAQIYLGDTNFDNASYFNSAPGLGAVFSATGVAGDLAFYVYNQVVNSRREVARMLYNGNVGIGTTSPSYKLDVSGITRISSDLLIQNTFNPFNSTNRGNITLNGTADNIVAFTDNTNIKGYVYHDGTNIQLLNNVTGGYLSLFTQGTEKVRVTSSGNVGIGTTSPSYKLEVNGSIGATAFYETSDIRFKEVLSYNHIVDLSSLKLIQYRLIGDSSIRYGYSAQDVQALCPELVGGTSDKLTLNYKDIHSIKIAALEQEIRELKAQLNLN